jgi:hypothetical protein
MIETGDEEADEMFTMCMSRSDSLSLQSSSASSRFVFSLVILSLPSSMLFPLLVDDNEIGDEGEDDEIDSECI